MTIRGYGDQARFVQANAEKLDTNQASYFLGTIANRWLAVRLELIGACHHVWVVLTDEHMYVYVYVS